MAREIELKLLISAADTARLPAHPRLAGIAGRRQRLVSTYYDTPDEALRRQAIALRFRRAGDNWLLTVKGGDPARGGLAARAEWETPRTRGDFDFSHVLDAGLRAFLEDLRPRLVPVFTTDFTRTTWNVEEHGCAIELALDRGHIAAAGRRAEISELEMELLASSDPQPLFGLAIDLATELALYPASASKAERGYALFHQTPAVPARGGKTALTRQTPAREAFRNLAFDCLNHLQDNHPGLLADDNPEFLHQSRVAIRRLRCLISVFAPHLPADFLATYRAPWRTVAQAMGEPRDWDVLLQETLPRVTQESPLPASRLRRLQAAAGKARNKAIGATRTTLGQTGYGRFLLLFTRDLLSLDAQAGAPRGPSLHDQAARHLEVRLRKIRRTLKRDALDDAPSRHRLRIAFKKLRYALEFLAPLVPPKHHRRLVRKTGAAQQTLGHLNDLETARRLLAGLGNNPDGITDWLDQEKAQALAELPTVTKPFRRRPALR